MTESEDLTLWLEDLQGRLSRLLDPGNPLEQERKCQELVAMSNRLLFLSRCLMELATKASDAAQSMVRPPASDEIMTT